MISELPDKSKVGLSFSNLANFLPRSQDTDDVEKGEHRGGATKVDGTPAEMGHQEEPTGKGSSQSQGISTEVQVVDRVGLEADLLIEVGGVIGNGCTVHDLTHKADTGDLCSAKLESLKAVRIRCADGKLLFEIVGVDDGSKCLLRVNRAVRGLKTP